jgi:RecA/RadA recombinase
LLIQVLSAKTDMDLEYGSAKQPDQTFFIDRRAGPRPGPGGGLTSDRLFLIEGEPGTGKTTLALQFLQ